MKELFAIIAFVAFAAVVLWVFWWIAPLIALGAFLGGFLFG